MGILNLSMVHPYEGNLTWRTKSISGYHWMEEGSINKSFDLEIYLCTKGICIDIILDTYLLVEAICYGMGCVQRFYSWISHSSKIIIPAITDVIRYHLFPPIKASI